MPLQRVEGRRGPERGRGPKVLVVSRDGARLLEPIGADTRRPIVVHTSADAVLALRRGRVDAVIIDADHPASPPSESYRRLSRGAAVLLTGETADAHRRGFDALLPSGTPPRARKEILRLAACLTRSRRKAADLARRLRHSETRFRDIIQRNADAILVVDAEGIIQFANAMAAETFGRPLESLLGAEFGHPLVAGETIELDLVTRGRSVVVEMRVVESHWEGRKACVASLRDITERRRAEEDARRLMREQLARSAAEAVAARFRFLAESGAILSSSLDQSVVLASLCRLCTADLAEWAIALVCDEAGRPIQVEAAARSGDGRPLEARELLRAGLPGAVRTVMASQRPTAFSSDDDSDRDRLLEIADSGDTSRLGHELRLIVPIASYGRSHGALLLGNSSPEGLDSARIALAEDLAGRAALALENARLYGAAQNAIQEKTDYLAVISHDLRTPLNSIIGHSELLSMGIPDQLSDQGRIRVERIRSSAGHLIHLIDELLTLARFDAGHGELNITVVDARAVVRDIMAVVDVLAADKGLELRVSIPSTSILLLTDEDRLRQVLLNLVANAIKYTDAGSVSVSLAADESGAVFRVEDTGIGIASEHLESIFKPFWQVDGSRRANGGGTGLGLSVVRRLAALLEGELSVRSEPGKGSEFSFRVPSRAARGGSPDDDAPEGDASDDVEARADERQR